MKSNHPLALTLLFLLTLPSTLLAQQAPKPPEPDAIRLRGEEEPANARPANAQSVESSKPSSREQPIHGVEPFKEDGIKVYRYPDLGRPGEIFMQGMGGMSAVLYALVMADELLYWELQDNPKIIYPSTALTLGLASTLAVHGIGHGNGSRSEVLATVVGSLTGSALSTFFLYSSKERDNDIIPYDMIDASLLILPTFGAILGYQLFSSWKTNKTKKTRSIASTPLF